VACATNSGTAIIASLADNVPGTTCTAKRLDRAIPGFDWKNRVCGPFEKLQQSGI
jgi:hypothetical protein